MIEPVTPFDGDDSMSSSDTAAPVARYASQRRGFESSSDSQQAGGTDEMAHADHLKIAQDGLGRFTQLELALQNAADSMPCTPTHFSANEILTELHRRRSVRRVKHLAAYGLGSVATVIAFVTAAIWWTPRVQQKLPVTPEIVQVVPRPNDSPNEVQSKSDPSALQTVDQPTPSSRFTLNQILASTVSVGPYRVFKNAPARSSESDPIPVLLEVKQANGQVVFAPAWVVPERSERMDWSRLNSDERRAILQVLELESDPNLSDQPII